MLFSLPRRHPPPLPIHRYPTAAAVSYSPLYAGPDFVNLKNSLLAAFATAEFGRWQSTGKRETPCCLLALLLLQESELRKREGERKEERKKDDGLVKTQQSAKRESGNLVHRYLVVVITSVPFIYGEVPFASHLKVAPIAMAPIEVNTIASDRALLVQCYRQGCCVRPLTVSGGIIGFGNG